MSIRPASLLILVAFAAGCGDATASAVASAGRTFDAAPSPSPSPAATAPLAPLESGFRYLWVREPTDIPGLTQSPIAAAIALQGTILEYHATVPVSGPLQPVLRSSIGADPEHQVHTRLIRDGSGCRAGDEGVYTFTLTDSGDGLQVRAAGDACAVRSTVLVGDWIRAACPIADQWCLGPLDPGRHVSINYRPFGDWKSWSFAYGRFGYTVPAGWTNLEDNADGFSLGPAAGPEGAGIFAFTDPRAHAQGADCPHRLAPSVDGSAEAIAAWLRSLPGLDVTHVEPVVVGGLNGTSMDVAIDPHWKQTCPWDTGGIPIVPLLLNAEHEDFEWGIGGDGRMRLDVLALEPGRALIVDIEASTDAAWKALLPTAVPIVESFSFAR